MKSWTEIRKAATAFLKRWRCTCCMRANEFNEIISA